MSGLFDTKQNGKENDLFQNTYLHNYINILFNFKLIYF